MTTRTTYKTLALAVILMTASQLHGQTPLPYRQSFDDISDFETFLIAN